MQQFVFLQKNGVKSEVDLGFSEGRLIERNTYVCTATKVIMLTKLCVFTTELYFNIHSYNN